MSIDKILEAKHKSLKMAMQQDNYHAENRSMGAARSFVIQPDGSGLQLSVELESDPNRPWTC